MPGTAAPRYEIFNATQGGAISGSQGGAGGRQEERMACLPLTVRMAEDAIERQKAAGSDELCVHGVEVGQASVMLFVGAVEHLAKQAASVQFVLNDGTGRIRVRHFSSGDVGSAGFDQIVDGGYITIAGSLRTSPTLHVSATFLHPVFSVDAVSYHMIEAAHAGLKLKQMASGVNTTLPLMPAKLKEPMPDVASVPTPQHSLQPALGAGVLAAPAAASAGGMPFAAPPRSTAAMKRVVIEFLRREGEGKEAGVHISAVCQGVNGDEATIRPALAALIEDGDVYTTINEDNFAVL